MNDDIRLGAMVLAAGEGRRMRPLTELYPKASLKVLDTPALEIIVEKLVRFGASEIHCNLFHLPEPLLEIADGRGWPLTFHREERLLGTGGGVGNMADALRSSEAIILHNGDIITDLDLDRAITFHRSQSPLVTMVLASTGPPQNVSCTREGEITAIATLEDSREQRFGYTGISILAPEALEFFPAGEPAELVPILRRMIAERPGSVRGFLADELLWAEIGSPRAYLSLHQIILSERRRIDPLLEPPPMPLFVSEEAAVEPGAEWRGFLSVQSGARVDAGSLLEDCVLLEGAHIERGAHLTGSIIFKDGIMTPGSAGERGDE